MSPTEAPEPAAVPSVRAGDDARDGSDLRTWGLFLALAVMWGSSFLFIKALLQEGVPPITIVLGRTLLGGIFLGLVLLLARGRLRLSLEVWRRMGFLGLTNIVIPYVLIAWGQQYIPTGMASILNALVPIFTFVLAAGVFHDEALTRLRVGGLVLGFVGVVLLALPSLGAAVDDADSVLALEGMLTVAAAGVSYAVAAVYTRRRLATQPLVTTPDGTTRPPTPLELALGSTLVALLVVAILALALERPADGLLHLPVSLASWFGLLWLGALGSGIAYLVFYAVLERWGPTRTTLVTYVIPVAAISLGFIVLGERLRPIELLGAALVIGGVVLVNGTVGRRGIGTEASVTPASADLDARARS